MWPRVVEIMLGLWLAVSPFIFGHIAHATSFWINDILCAVSTVALATLSLWRRLRRAHLAIIVVASWLVGFGFTAAPYPTPPPLQNDIVIGLLLLMFAIIPNNTNAPPEAWQQFFEQERRTFS